LLPLFASSVRFFYLLLLFASSICFFYLLLLFAFFGCFLWLLPSFCFLHFANPMNGRLYDHLDVLLQHHQNTLNVIYGNTYQVFVLLLSTGTSHLEMGRGKAQSCKSTTCLVIQETPSPSPSPSPAPDMPASPALAVASKMVAKPKKVLDADAEIQEFWTEMKKNNCEYWRSHKVLKQMLKETFACYEKVSTIHCFLKQNLLDAIILILFMIIVFRECIQIFVRRKIILVRHTLHIWVKKIINILIPKTVHSRR
jgi:hypothetical protein